MKIIYVDTSVFGGKFDPEFDLWTDLFFKKIFDSDIKMMISNVAEDELMNAPSKVKDFLKSTEESILLAEKYLDERVVGESS